MIGPTVTAARTCVSGQSCFIDSIVGKHLDGSDYYLVLDTCGVGQMILQLPATGAGVPTSSGTAVSWGTPEMTGPGGQYRLCWCASGFSCSASGDFRLDAGSLTIVGESTLGYTATCVSGQTCSLDGIVGKFISGTDSLMVLETCSVSSSIHGFPASGSLTVGSSGTAVSFGAVQVTAVGGLYRLCWCGSGFDCEIAADFRTDIGMLQIKGPSTAHARDVRTCISGQTCAFDSMEGRYYSDGDRVMVMDTCGTPDMVSGFTAAGLVSTTAASGSSLSWGNTIVSPAGGQYRLCWCAEGYSCSVGEDFAMTIGELEVVGVQAFQSSRTCVAGQTCKVDDIVGRHMTASDSFIVLETCGAGGSANMATVLYGFPSAGTATQVSASGGSATWGADVLTAGGGKYRLCWCSSQGVCETAEDFSIDVSEFVVVGPAETKATRTCVSGQSCSITGLLGQYLSASDSIVMMDTCGASSQLSFVHPLGNTALASYVSSFVGSSGASMSWGNIMISASGGLYRLCWCASGFDCDAEESFKVDLGSLSLIGPTLGQTRTCVTGQTCYEDGIRGHLLSGNDAVMVLETCGTRSSVEGFPAAGLVQAAGASGSAFNWGAVVLSAMGGRYRLCWCSSSFVCSIEEDYGLDFGELRVLGRSEVTQATCVSGQTCRITGILAEYSSSSDMFMVLETCGNADSSGVVPGFPSAGFGITAESSGAGVSWGALPMTAFGGTYRVCWCSAGFACSETDDYQIDVGSMKVIGPLQLSATRTCVVGRTCALDGLRGVELSNTDSFMVLETCGAATPVAGFPSAALAVSGSRSGATVSWGAESLTASGGTYRICWCAGGQRCALASEHVLEIGELVLRGPERRGASGTTHSWTRTCVAGQTCQFDGVLGYHLAETDDYLLLETCGKAGLPVGLSFGGAAVQMSASGASVSWSSVPFTVQGGHYRLCWCAGDFPCSTYEQFLVDVGKVTVVGPERLTMERTCVAGRTCSLDGITGTQLMATDSFVVLDTCGTIGTVDAFPSGGIVTSVTRSGASVSWGNVPVTATGGRYRVCWCAGGFGCNTGLDYFAEVPSLRISSVAHSRLSVVIWQSVSAFEGEVSLACELDVARHGVRHVLCSLFCLKVRCGGGCAFACHLWIHVLSWRIFSLVRVVF